MCCSTRHHLFSQIEGSSKIECKGMKKLGVGHEEWSVFCTLCKIFAKKRHLLSSERALLFLSRFTSFTFNS